MKIFLLVIFTLDGQNIVIDGWGPREQPSLEVCLERADFAKNYIDSLDLGKVSISEVVCDSMEEILKKFNQIM